MKKRGKILVVISALILTLITCIAFIAAVEVVTDSTSLDTSYLFLFPKKTPTTGNTISEQNAVLVTIKANEEVGRVRDDFYGVNDGFFRLSKSTKIDLDKDNIAESFGNYEFHRNAFLESNMDSVMLWVDLPSLSTGDGTFNYNRINILKEEIRYLYDKNKTIIIDLRGGIPNYLQDRSSTYCNSTMYGSCPPNYNLTFLKLFDNLIFNITDGFTNNYSMSFEIQNEPYGDSWLNALPLDDPIKGKELAYYFSYIYNYTKPKYPFINIGGCGFFTVHPKITNAFLSNLSSNIDFISTHPYDYLSTNSYVQRDSVKELLELCSTYSVNCGYILLSEWTVGTA